MSRREERAADDRELELLKAVAQAWHGHSGNPQPTREFDAAAGPRGDGGRHQRRPTRFRLEAIRQKQAEDAARWDFGQSLWDSYEIVTLSKRLESSLAPEEQHAVDGGGAATSEAGRRSTRESNNSLRRLLRMSSRRFHG